MYDIQAIGSRKRLFGTVDAFSLTYNASRGTPLPRAAEVRFDRALELDEHGISEAILRGRDFDSDPTLGHVVFAHTGLLDAIEANTHVPLKNFFVVEGAPRIDREAIRWNVYVLVLWHGSLSSNAASGARLIHSENTRSRADDP